MRLQEKEDSFRWLLAEQLAMENEAKIREIVDYLFDEAINNKEFRALELILEYFLCKAPKLVEHSALEISVDNAQ